MKIIMTVCGVFLILVLQSLHFAQSTEPPVESFAKAPANLAEVRADLIKRVQERKEPSYAVAVVQNGKIIWGETIGWADREAGMAAASDTRYAVASVSKSITGTGAMVLSAQDKLNLDSTVSRVLGNSWISFAEFQKGEIKISQLLNHTSGIPHLWHYEFEDEPASIVGTDLLTYNHGNSVAPPGERYLYSNLGFGVLGQIIGKAGGSSFQIVMAKEFFSRIEMPKTTTAGWLGEGGYARGYDDKGMPVAYHFRLAPDGGAGFFTTVRDLAKYMLFHLDEEGFPVEMRPASISRSLKSLPSYGRFTYERGWGIVKLPDSTVLISDGRMAGGTAAIVLVPERRLGVVVMCNMTGGPSDSTAVRILNAIIPGFEKEFGDAIGPIEKEIGKPSEMPKGVFDGTIGIGPSETRISLDLNDLSAPVLILAGERYLLQNLSWERGNLLATAVGTISFGVGKGRVHNLNFTLWGVGDGVDGYVQEEIMDTRPRSGHPFPVSLKMKKE